jgi:hypothetical protein
MTVANQLADAYSALSNDQYALNLIQAQYDQEVAIIQMDQAALDQVMNGWGLGANIQWALSASTTTVLNCLDGAAAVKGFSQVCKGVSKTCVQVPNLTGAARTSCAANANKMIATGVLETCDNAVNPETINAGVVGALPVLQCFSGGPNGTLAAQLQQAIAAAQAQVAADASEIKHIQNAITNLNNLVTSLISEQKMLGCQ